VNGTGFNGTGYVSGYFDKSDVGGDAEVTPCLDGSWCSGANNLLCCQQNQGFTLDLTTGLAQQQLTSNTTAPHNVTTSTATKAPTQLATTSSARPTTTPAHTSAGGEIKTMQAVAITLASAGVLLVLIAACWLIARRRRSKSIAAASATELKVHYLPEHRAELQNDPRQCLRSNHAPDVSTTDKQQWLQEKMVDSVRHEMFTSVRHEMGTSTRHELAG
jgi:hypothetical protein